LPSLTPWGRPVGNSPCQLEPTSAIRRPGSRPHFPAGEAMAREGRRAWLVLVLAACLPGCLQDIERTHAKPVGLRYFGVFDHRACRLAVRPRESTSPARSQVVLIAAVTDTDGKPLPNRRVEWILEGAGNIIEVDESGYSPGRGYKV